MLTWWKAVVGWRRHMGSTEMAVFKIILEPIAMCPAVREMHRQTKRFEAPSQREACRMVREAFQDGVDDSGTWVVVGKPKPE